MAPKNPATPLNDTERAGGLPPGAALLPIVSVKLGLELLRTCFWRHFSGDLRGCSAEHQAAPRPWGGRGLEDDQGAEADDLVSLAEPVHERPHLGGDEGLEAAVQGTKVDPAR
jgi:hypothetical protein